MPNADDHVKAIKATARSVADSLMFAAPEAAPMHVQRLLDTIFEEDTDRPVVWRES